MEFFCWIYLLDRNWEGKMVRKRRILMYCHNLHIVLSTIWTKNKRKYTTNNFFISMFFLMRICYGQYYKLVILYKHRWLFMITSKFVKRNKIMIIYQINWFVYIFAVNIPWPLERDDFLTHSRSDIEYLSCS